MKVERGHRDVGRWWFLFCVGRELGRAHLYGVASLGWYRFDLALLKTKMSFG